MLLNLKVLRGVDLLALDENYLTESSSDPYCQIFVNGVKVGWTPVRNATLDPVWGDAMSSFEIQGGGGTRVTIKIFDYDGALSDDDYMGQVTFYAQDFLDRTSDKYPNIWATIEPPEGRIYAGKLQLRIAAPADEKKKKSRRLMSSFALSRKKPPLKLSAGPSVAPEIKSCLHKHLFFAKAPVILHVYDVGKDSRIHALNQVLPATGAGGIFHGAIEVHGREYSFGYAPRAMSGVFACQPQSCPMHTFRESIFLGDCHLTPSQVQAILRQIKPEWIANTYNLLEKNCCTFSNEFAIELGVGPIPEWVHALAHTAVALNEVLGRKERVKEHHLRTTWRQLPVEEDDHCSILPNLVLAHVMARRLQRAFWARKAQRVARGEVPIACIGKTLVRQATVSTYQGSGLEVQSIDDDDDDEDFRDDQVVVETSPHSPERRQRELQQTAKRASTADLLPPAQLLKNLKEHMTKDELTAGFRNMRTFFGLAE